MEQSVIRRDGGGQGQGTVDEKWRHKINGAFRPEKKSPDFNLSVQAVKTQVKSPNSLLRAYGGVDAVSSIFSVFSEITVKDGKVPWTVPNPARGNLS